MTRGIRAIVYGLALVAIGCPSRSPLHPLGPDRAAALGSQSDCLPSFEDQDGWLGGDAAASVLLPDRAGRASVWLFGDSFVARPGETPVRTYPFVHNSIAVSRCAAGGRWSLDFAWGRDAVPGSGPGGDERAPAGEPHAFFEPDPSAAWVQQVRHATGAAPYYWPISGATLDGTLFVALLRVAPSPARGPFRLPFRAIGVDLARIEDTEGPPETWRIRYSTLSSRSDLLPATSLVATRDHLFTFASVDRGDGRTPRVLSRLPAPALATWRPDLESALELLTADGRWQVGADPHAARILMADDASEMSVHYDPGLGAWLAVYSDPTPDGAATSAPRPTRADAIWLRRARRLEGPWSLPVAIGRIPELAITDDPPPGEPFCYAGKAHPELAPSGELLVTYVCNFWAARADESGAVLERLRTSPAFYRPRAVRLKVPEASGQT